ncbi:MAG: aldose 1-epimerase family protein [Eubacteriales bacterium]|nr:aldose 1-epimerase family protein [Eubacteriales bacterium]
MKKSQEHDLRRKAGNLDSLYGFKDYTFNDGPEKGMRAFDLDNGKNTRLTVLADRGLDIPSFYYKGKNIAFQSKTGLRSPFLYQEEGARGFLKQFYAGLLTTCGLTYAGAAAVDKGQALGLHGPFSNTPAGKVAARTVYDGDEAVIEITGQVRQAQVFEENLVLKRVLRLHTETDALEIEDTVENQGFDETPLMLVYHVNFGYPLLDEGARVYSTAGLVSPRDEIAKSGYKDHAVIEAPGVQRPEECFFHTRHPGKEAFAMLHNENLGMAAVLHFDANALPLLCQWKCMRAGDYALGLEPTTSGVMGRPAAREDGSLVLLKAGESRVFSMMLTLTDNSKTIREHISRATK